MTKMHGHDRAGIKKAYHRGELKHVVRRKQLRTAVAEKAKIVTEMPLQNEEE